MTSTFKSLRNLTIATAFAAAGLTTAQAAEKIDRKSVV